MKMVRCGAKPETPSFEDFRKAVFELQKKSEKKAAKKQTA